MTIYPNVPNVPGVPPLLRNPFAVQPIIELLTRDPFSLLLDSIAPQWGLYQDGAPVILSDNTVSFEYRQDWAIADFPIERGAFGSYDKVTTPFEARLQVSSGGSQYDRQALLGSVAAVAGTLDLYDLVTPEQVYTDVNVQHYDYRRTAENGVGLLVIEIRLIQIRETVTAAFTQTNASPLTNTKEPSGADPVNSGTVQPTPYTPSRRAQQFMGG